MTAVVPSKTAYIIANREII